MSTAKTKGTHFLVYVAIFLLLLPLHSQEIEDPVKQEVRSLVRFYEYMLNTLGSDGTTLRDKEVIIRESFAKAFTNPRVQVEDDLLDDRSVITNKDIQAYLRDVDFFFQEVSFRFDSVQVKEEKKPNDEPFYLVSFEKTIEGTSLEGEPIKKIEQRFLEVNVDQENADLKIASVYTTKVTREQELSDWYNSLSFGWLHLFDQYVTYDSITAEVIQQMADLDSINLSENQFLRNIAPLSALKHLRYLNINNTQIKDLSPLRYSTNIQTLVANNTPVHDLTFFQYFDQVMHLELQNTQVENMTSIANLQKLEVLNVSGTPLLDSVSTPLPNSLKKLDLSKTDLNQLRMLQGLAALTTLDISHTKVSNLQPLQNLVSLTSLNASNTNLQTLEGIENHPALETIDIRKTQIASLAPINNLPQLKRIEADLSRVSATEADQFMETHPSVVVIVNSQEIKDWWLALPSDWQTFFKRTFELETPSKEELIDLVKVDSLDLSNTEVSDPDPLNRLTKLRYLNISNTSISSLEFVEGMGQLQVLFADNIEAQDLAGLSKARSLTHLSLVNVQMNNIQVLKALPMLKFVDLNDAEVPESQIVEMLQYNEDLHLLWRSAELETWWNGLPKAWKIAFNLQNPTPEKLHKLTHSDRLELTGTDLRDFSAIRLFINLQELDLNQTGILSLSGLDDHQNLHSLRCTNGPLRSVEGLAVLSGLATLDIANTAIDDLQALGKISSLKRLNCSGTNIKRLKGMENLFSLEYLNVSNTNVFKLDRLGNLPDLKELVCFNTRLRQFEIDKFQERLPDCKIVFY